MYCCVVNKKMRRFGESKPYLHSTCNAQARGMKSACASDGSQVQHRLHAHAPGRAMPLVPTASPNPAFDCVITGNVDNTWLFWSMNFLIFWMQSMALSFCTTRKTNSVSLWTSCCPCRACASCFLDFARVHRKIIWFLFSFFTCDKGNFLIIFQSVLKKNRILILHKCLK